MTDFKFYLKFVSLGQNFLYQITEPVGFDGAKYVEKQKTNKYGRDTSYVLDFTFYATNGLEVIENEQVINVLGNTSKHLNMGLDWILESHKRFGFESKIELHINDFYLGLLDSANPETDELNYYGCNIIQDNNISDYKKHESTVLNMFGTKNVKNEIITPISTSKVLKKSPPVTRLSRFSQDDNFIDERALFGTDGVFFMPCRNIVESGFTSTLTPINGIVERPIGQNTAQINALVDNFKILKSVRSARNVKISIKDLTYYTNTLGFFTTTQLRILWGTTPNVSNVNTKQHTFFNTDGQPQTDATIVDQDFEFTIPFLEINENVWLFFSIFCPYSTPAGTPIATVGFEVLNSLKIEITAEELSIDTVIPMARYIDMMKQCSKNINNTPIVAPKFDVGGQYYDQFCFNRALISGKTEVPFNTKFKEILESVEEVNGDFEISKNNIFVGQYADFYENVENAVFSVIPSKESKVSWNKRFLINYFKFLYKTFEQNRDSKDTIEAIHTQADFIILNNNVENKKEISCDLIRDPYAQKVAIELETSKPQTSDQNDDKVYINDVVALPENTTGNIKANLYVRTINGFYEILNREIEQEEEESVINWLTLGFNIGQLITFGTNDYFVESITRTVLRLAGSTTPINANYFCDITWFYLDVNFKSKTDEGFAEIVGVSTPTEYQGLNFSIRRNIKTFSSFLATACFYIKGSIVNNYFKNSPKLGTRKTGEIDILYEASDILITDLDVPILTPKIFKLSVYSSWQQFQDYLASKQLNRGFVRCFWLDNRIIKGYVQDYEYNFRTGELELTLEEKFENPILILTLVNEILTVNDVIYNLQGVNDWYLVTNEHFQFFDSNNISICNPYRFDKISLNGNIYQNSNDLINNLI